MIFDNTNSGVLFPEENVEGKRPQYTGRINVDGIDYELACWTRTAKTTGKAFLSLKIQRSTASAPSDGISF